VTLKKARKGLIAQREAAGELDLSLRQVQRLPARFVRHDSTEENMRLLWSYLEKYGRLRVFYRRPGVHCELFCICRDASYCS